MLAKVQRASDPPDTCSETGASAVEFALVLPLLMLFLLGTIQYGFGLYQLQNFNSILSDAAKQAGTGISTCSDFNNQLQSLASRSGLGNGAITNVGVDWLTRPDVTSGNFSTSADAKRYGLAQVTATLHPFRLGLPFVPFPAEITKTESAPVMNTGILGGGC